jgi:Asp-tRNA(Asn)/Glu-tRNA(Gln) amidotransferase A subunit family amidase
MLQAVFSSTGLPSITIPLSPSAEGLPHALQLAAAPGADMHLLDVAAWCADALRPAPPHRPQ